MSDNTVEMHSDARLGGTSTQIGTQNNYYGMTYKDTKELCTELIKSELAIYREEAEELAVAREEKFKNTFLNKLGAEKLQDETVAEEFKNPDMQYAYVEAQKSFIRVGTDELENILSSLLVERVKENKRTLLQIVLNEAISIVPTLLPEQIDILALTFLLRQVRFYNISSKEDLCEDYRTMIRPFVLEGPIKDSVFQHIAYSKCGTLSTGFSIGGWLDPFKKSCPGLFMNGFTLDEIKDQYERYPMLFTTCFHDEIRFQFAVVSKDDLLLAFDELNVDVTDKQPLQRLYESNIMSEDKIREILVQWIPEVKSLINLWQSSKFPYLTLTSVGIALAVERIKEVTGEQIDIGIWI